jgi:Cd2+/Zn2+-exporting ATPase
MTHSSGASADASGTAADVESLSVPEMDCPSCAGKVEHALEQVPGVTAYDLQPTTGTVSVTYDADVTTHDAVVRAIENAGYGVEDVDTADGPARRGTSVWHSRRAKLTAVSGVLAFLGLLVEFALPANNTALATIAGGSEVLVADALFLAAVAVGGQVILQNGYYSARNLSLDIDFLMSVAILGATGVSLAVPGVSLYVEAASLAVLFNVAELLERYSVDRARDSLAELLELSPDTARVEREDGTVDLVPVDEVDPGDRIVVQPGEKVSMDGTVVDGRSAVDESPITGESVPVDKSPGDDVYAGTINEQGYLELEATGYASENTISRIVELVEDAQANKTKREQFVERFSGYYTPVVVAFAILVAAVPPLLLGAPWPVWFVRGISLLVIACPCAFVISTPVTVVSGVTSAAKNGVLVKGGDHLEAMGEVNAIAFDKTGTLTTGELAVTDVIPLGDNTEADVLRCARGLETRSEHPISEAIVAHAADGAAGDTPARTVSGFESITGKGVRADLDGTTHFAGKPGLFSDLGFDLNHVHLATDGGRLTQHSRTQCARAGCLDLVEDLLPELQGAGKTVVLVGTADDLEGVIAVADEVRPDARATVQALRDLGVQHLVMLTGDNEGTARAVAEEVGVDAFRANLLPEAKVDAVSDLDDEYGGVAMVGDGINDAPALATATVGVAMGAAGTDTAIETADIALMADDLAALPYLYDLAHRANRVIRQNIWGSLAVKAALAVAIPLVYIPVWFVVLAGDVGMTTLVTGNAMRLSRLAPTALTRD